MIKQRILLSLLLGLLWCSQATLAYTDNQNTLPLNKLQLPTGFRIELYAQNVGDVGEMAVSSNGIVYVGTQLSGKILALVPRSDYRSAKTTITLAEGLDLPYGVALHQKNLYVAEGDKILRYADIDQRIHTFPIPGIFLQDLPYRNWNGSKYIKFDTSGNLFLGVGMPCSICIPKDTRFGSIMKLPKDSDQLELYAQGIHHTLGFDWDPKTHHFWFSDNTHGEHDEFPGEINCALVKQMHFGFPYYLGYNQPSTPFGQLRSSTELTPPAYGMPEHIQPADILFYTGKQFPEEYRQQLIVATQGSFFKQKAYGAQLWLLTVNDEKITQARPFVSGWNNKSNFWGQPNSLAMLPDGSLLIGDAAAHAIYRLSYVANSTEKDGKKT